jgi:hypothetical protein
MSFLAYSFSRTSSRSVSLYLISYFGERGIYAAH